MNNQRLVKTSLSPDTNLRNPWEGLEIFVAVAESGHFGHVAERLGVSASPVSRSIARLEERLQTQLLYRSTRWVAG